MTAGIEVCRPIAPPHSLVFTNSILQRLVHLLRVDVPNKELETGLYFLIVSYLTHATDLAVGISMDSLVNAILDLLRPCVHLIDALSVRISSLEEELLYHLLAHLLTDNLFDFLVVKESDFPFLVTEALGEVLKVCRLVPLDVIQ